MLYKLPYFSLARARASLVADPSTAKHANPSASLQLWYGCEGAGGCRLACTDDVCPANQRRRVRVLLGFSADPDAPSSQVLTSWLLALASLPTMYGTHGRSAPIRHYTLYERLTCVGVSVCCPVLPPGWPRC